MSNDSSKTHDPTSMRLLDARRKGDIYKSRDLTNTTALVSFLLTLVAFGPYVFDLLINYVLLVIGLSGKNLSLSLPQAISVGIHTLLSITLILLLPTGLLALLVEFLQVGSVFALEKVRPDLKRINPSEGTKRIFSLNNLFEAIKSVIKGILVVIVVYFVIRHALQDTLQLPRTNLLSAAEYLRQHTLLLIITISVVFLGVSLLDYLYQRQSYLKKLRMSVRDIQQENKNNEGDPMLRSRRRQLHQEWSERNVVESVRNSKAVITNPTHIAIAIQYNPDTTAVPKISAKGEGAIAVLIRKAAEEYGIPILQDIALARALNKHARLDETIPEEYFEAVAEVLAWAGAIRPEQHPESHKT